MENLNWMMCYFATPSPIGQVLSLGAATWPYCPGQVQRFAYIV